MTAIDVHAVSAGTMHAAALEAMCAHTGGFLRLIKSFGEPLLVSLGPSLLRVSARTLTVRAYSSQSLELQHVIGAMNLVESSQFVSQFTALVGESWQGFTFYYDVVDELSEGDFVSLQVIVMASLGFVSFLDACVQVEISWSSEDGSHRTRVFPSRIALASSLPVVLSKLSPFACCMAIAKQATAKANENDAASAKQYVNACVRALRSNLLHLLVSLFLGICNTPEVGFPGFIPSICCFVVLFLVLCCSTMMTCTALVHSFYMLRHIWRLFLLSHIWL